MLDAKLGLLKKDTVLDIEDTKAQFYVVRGYAKVYMAKVVDDQPIVVDEPKVANEQVTQPERKRTKKTKVVHE